MITESMSLMTTWRQIVLSHELRIRDFIRSCEQIGKAYEKSKTDREAEDFNVFRLISDLYYRENFHSDIMSYFLEPRERHGCGSAFLDQFISMLNKVDRNIDSRDYADAVAVREEARIDILIKSESSRRAIIIENKINNAGDMPRQLPRYYDYVSPNYEIDAIVYVPLDRSKTPDMTDWSAADKAHVLPLLTVIPACDKEKTNIVRDWLIPSANSAKNLDVASVLRQYSKLVEQLNLNIMDTIILEKFYQELVQPNNLESAQSIRNMLNDMPAYLALRIQDKFGQSCHPFMKIWIYQSRDAVFEGAVIDGIYLKMDIWCSENGYDAIFWSPEDKGASEEEFSGLVSRMDSMKGFRPREGESNSLNQHFGFQEEPRLIATINDILKELAHLENSSR